MARAFAGYSSEPKCVPHGVTEPAQGTHRAAEGGEIDRLGRDEGDVAVGVLAGFAQIHGAGTGFEMADRIELAADRQQRGEVGIDRDMLGTVLGFDDIAFGIDQGAPDAVADLVAGAGEDVIGERNLYPVDHGGGRGDDRALGGVVGSPRDGCEGNLAGMGGKRENGERGRGHQSGTE